MLRSLTRNLPAFRTASAGSGGAALRQIPLQSAPHGTLAASVTAPGGPGLRRLAFFRSVRLVLHSLREPVPVPLCSAETDSLRSLRPGVLRSNCSRSLPVNLPPPRTACTSGCAGLLRSSAGPASRPLRRRSSPADFSPVRLLVARPARQAHLCPPRLLPFASPRVLSPSCLGSAEPAPALHPQTLRAPGSPPLPTFAPRYAASLRSAAWILRSGLRRRNALAPLASAKPSQAQDWHACSAAALRPAPASAQKRSLRPSALRGSGKFGRRQPLCVSLGAGPSTALRIRSSLPLSYAPSVNMPALRRVRFTPGRSSLSSEGEGAGQ